MFGFMCNIGWFKPKEDLKAGTPVFVSWGWPGASTFTASIVQKGKANDSYIVKVKDRRDTFYEVDRKYLIVREDVSND